MATTATPQQPHSTKPQRKQHSVYEIQKRLKAHVIPPPSLEWTIPLEEQKEEKETGRDSEGASFF
jgi:hypothetical protein